jgi:hypothetical protein
LPFYFVFQWVNLGPSVRSQNLKPENGEPAAKESAVAAGGGEAKEHYDDHA